MKLSLALGCEDGSELGLELDEGLAFGSMLGVVQASALGPMLENNKDLKLIAPRRRWRLNS